VEIDGVAQMPGVRRSSGVEEGNGNGGDVAELNEFVARVVRAVEVRGMIHDLADDNGADAGIGVGSAGALAELFDAARIVHAKGAGAHGDEFLAGVAGNVTAKGDAVIGRAEFDDGAVAGEGVVGGGAEGDLVAMGAEGKG